MGDEDLAGVLTGAQEPYWKKKLAVRDRWHNQIENPRRRSAKRAVNIRIFPFLACLSSHSRKDTLSAATRGKIPGHRSRAKSPHEIRKDVIEGGTKDESR